MATILEELITVLGFQVDESGVNRYTKILKNVAVAGAQASAVIASTATAIVAFTTATNKEIALQSRLADSVSMSADTVSALAGVVSEAGFNFENIIDLAEELNNKIGESKGLEITSAVKDSLKVLGVEFSKIKDLSPEEQFKKITQAALDMGDSQKSAAALDMLMGGDANKIIGLLRTRGESLDAIIEKSKKLSFLNEKGRKGAILYNREFSGLTSTISSYKSQLSGLLGSQFAPYISKITAFILENKGAIEAHLESSSKKIASFLLKLYGSTKRLYDAFSFVSNALGVTNLSLLTIIASLWLLAAHPAVAAVVALYLAFDDLLTYIQGGDSVIGSFLKKLGELTGLDFSKGTLFSGIKQVIRFFTSMDVSLSDLVEGFMLWLGVDPSNSILYQGILLVTDLIDIPIKQVKNLIRALHELINLDFSALTDKLLKLIPSSVLSGIESLNSAIDNVLGVDPKESKAYKGILALQKLARKGIQKLSIAIDSSVGPPAPPPDKQSYSVSGHEYRPPSDGNEAILNQAIRVQHYLDTTKKDKNGASSSSVQPIKSSAPISSVRDEVNNYFSENSTVNNSNKSSKNSVFNSNKSSKNSVLNSNKSSKVSSVRDEVNNYFSENSTIVNNDKSSKSNHIKNVSKSMISPAPSSISPPPPISKPRNIVINNSPNITVRTNVKATDTAGVSKEIGSAVDSAVARAIERNNSSQMNSLKFSGA